MRALLAKLSEMDSTAESAVRVIATFDELTTHRASADALLRTAATLAECPAGMVETGRIPLRYDPLGRRLASAQGTPSIERDLLGDDEVIGRVWLERSGPPGSLDAIIIERMALVAEAIIERTHRGTGVEMHHPPAVDVVLDTKASDTEIGHAARTLLLEPRKPVRAILVSTPEDLAEQATLIARQVLRSAPTAWSVSGDSAVMLAQDLEHSTEFEATSRDCRIAVGPARPLEQARGSLEAASIAFRFAHSESRVVWYDDLGSRSLLSEVPTEEIAKNPDVQAIESLANGPSSPSDITVLEAVCNSGTLRGAAAEVHLHHSSIAHRLRNIEEILGFALDNPQGLFRARLALDLWILSGQTASPAN